jgi:uncharacterized SAM-binding protein YcdF (DUF218 family)
MPNAVVPARKVAASHRPFLAVVVLELAVALILWAIIKLGQWIVIEDRLTPASVIVVLSGQTPYRAMEAAALYHQHWAPEIWVTRSDDPDKEAAYRRLRMQSGPEEVESVEILEYLGVPAGRIRLLDRPVRNTDQEIHLIAEELRRVNSDQVILVTSPYHTRRVKVIWRAVVGAKPSAIVRYAYEEPYDPVHWWRNTQDALYAVRENLALLNAWAGFPLQPDRRY